ncbi:MAG TPA: ATP-binding protein [Hymenobacter sp.]|jgi:predicted HTH transcriptional regulator
MTEAELTALLERLLRLPAETEVVEFKEAANNYDFNKLGKYFSALSNEANLRGHGAGWLVFGVSNDKQVRGSHYRPERPTLDRLKGEIAAKASNGLTFREIHELQTADNKRVVLFEIPPALRGNPTAWEGHYYARNGEELTALNLDKLGIIRAQANLSHFEEETALAGQTADQVLQLIDYPEIFRMFGSPLPTSKAGILDRLQQERLVVRSGSSYSVTNLGAMLFARSLGAFPRLARKAVRVIFYAGNSRINTIREQPGGRGYALGFEGLVNYINNHLPGNEEVKKVTRSTATPLYPELALSELIANALIHQDFSVSGSSPMVEVFDNRIEISNPGRPLIDPQRFLDHTPQSRNEALAAVMRRLNICEERGSGIDKVIYECERHQLPPPDFIVGENYTRAILYSPKNFGQMDRQDKIRACYQHAGLKYVSGDIMTNQSLRERLSIDEANYPIASRIIADTIKTGFIKPYDPDNKSRKHAKYLPFWA